VRVEETITVNAPRREVWDYALDPANIPGYFKGMTRWDSKSRKKMGLGARYALRLGIGSADVGSLVEVVEWDPPGDMSWTSVTGLDHRFRMRMRDTDDGMGTEVRMKLAYQAPGGLLAVLSDWLSSRQVQGLLREALAELRREIESR
jgi:uncharacterized membrane protein